MFDFAIRKEGRYIPFYYRFITTNKLCWELSKNSTMEYILLRHLHTCKQAMNMFLKTGSFN